MKGKWKIVQTVFCIILLVILITPSLYITQYAYPVQDDFHYSYYAKEMMNQGHTLLTMALLKTWEYYITFCGCYASTFLGYIVEGIVQCNVTALRIFELFSMILFYIALFIFARTVLMKVMGIKKVLPIYCILVSFFTCLVYYGQHEVFYWFITSIQYLFLSSIILLGASFYINFCYYNCKRYFVAASVMGFLGAGAALHIAAFAFALYMLIGVWGMYLKKKRVVFIFGCVLIGGLINGVAPGNYLRDGKALTLERFVIVIKQSILYAFERIEMHMKMPVFWILIGILCLILLTYTSHVPQYEFRFPVLFFCMLFVMIAVVVFPVMLGYGWDVCVIMARGNFIFDMVIYLAVFLALLYIKGWLDHKYPQLSGLHINSDTKIAIVLCVLGMAIVLRGSYRDIPVIREVEELCAGKYEEYSEYCLGVYEKIAASEGEQPEIAIRVCPKEICMNDPQFYFGTYDPDEEFGNHTIAQYFGKKAVYLYEKE